MPKQFELDFCHVCQNSYFLSTYGSLKNDFMEFIIGIKWIVAETMACKYLGEKKKLPFKQSKTKLYMKLNLISDFNILALTGVLNLVLSNTILSFDLKDSRIC